MEKTTRNKVVATTITAAATTADGSNNRRANDVIPQPDALNFNFWHINSRPNVDSEMRERAHQTNAPV